MRSFLMCVFLLVGTAAPAVAQQQVERRVDRLEQEMRAVQRRVFPGGAGATVDPELQARTATPQQAIGSSNAITSLTSRVEALEAQLARLTGQVEENGFQIRQLEERMARERREIQGQIERLQQAAQPPAPAAEPAETTPPADDELAGGQEPAAADTPAAADPARATDPAEAAYNAGFRLWEQRRYGDAQRTLTTAADRHPRSRWASWSRNLAGRAYLDDGKPATAARIFLQNYQSNQRGERAADSLFFLGEALVRLNRRSEACPVYDELESTFPTMRDYLRSRLPAARAAARCGGGGSPSAN